MVLHTCEIELFNCCGTIYMYCTSHIIIIIIIIEGLSLLQSIPPTTADKQTQALVIYIVVN